MIIFPLLPDINIIHAVSYGSEDIQAVDEHHRDTYRSEPSQTEDNAFECYGCKTFTTRREFVHHNRAVKFPSDKQRYYHSADGQENIGRCVIKQIEQSQSEYFHITEYAE